MAEPISSQDNSPSAVRANLHSIAQTLSATKRLNPTTQKALAELVDELGNALASGMASNDEIAHLADSIAHLNQALGQQEDLEHSRGARQKLEKSIYLVEEKAPFIAGLAQRLLNALAEIGI